MMRDVNEIILNEVDIKISQINRYTVRVIKNVTLNGNRNAHNS